MKSSTQILLLFFFLNSLHVNAQELSTSILAQLDKVETAMFDATANGDSSAFRSLCATNYFSINADGASQTLEEAVPNVTRFKGSAYKLSDQKQRVFGNVALRTGRAKFYFGTQQVAEVLYTTGWMYRDKQWQYIHWQGTLTGMSLQGKGMTAPPKN